MYSKKYLIGPLDNIDQRGNHLNRVLDKLDRDVTMRVWEETCKVVDAVNKGSPLERRELPVIFIKEYRHTPTKLPEYPARNVPSVIQPGTLMWWSIDDVFEYLINPGYALFATTENVREYSSADVDGTDGGVGQHQGHGDEALTNLMKELVMRAEGEVRLGDIVRFLVEENNLFLSSDKLIKMPIMGSDSEEGERKSKEQYATTRQPTSNKDDAFVWKKKQVEEGTDKLSSEQKQMISKQKEREKKVELWKVQQRRRERELEQAARAEENGSSFDRFTWSEGPLESYSTLKSTDVDFKYKDIQSDPDLVTSSGERVLGTKSGWPLNRGQIPLISHIGRNLSTLQRHRAVQSEREREQAERSELLNREFTANDNTDTILALDAAISFNDKAMNSDRGLDRLLDSGAEALKQLRNQRSTLGIIKGRMSSVVSSLGLSQTVMKMVERRSTTDQIQLLTFVGGYCFVYDLCILQLQFKISDQRGNHLNRVLDKLDRDVTMRVWEETCKVVDAVNKGSPLERRELPVIFIKEYRHTPTKLPEYPARNVPSVIQPGTLMWWSIDDVFEYLINPGYALFATTENVREYSSADVDGTDGGVGQHQGHGDEALTNLMKELVMRAEGEVRLGDIVRFLVEENNLFLSSDKLIKMPIMGSDSEEGERKSKEQYATTRQPTSNKDDAFVWKKKQVEEGTDKLSSEQKQMISKQKEREKKVELWKVQQRRRERELEQAARAEEIDRERQEKEGVLFKEWQDQEGQFHLEQARKRSEIRIKDNSLMNFSLFKTYCLSPRANPIDLIAYYIYNANETSVEITGEPISVVENLNLEDLEDLQVEGRTLNTVQLEGRGTEAQTADTVVLCVFQQAERLIQKIGIKHGTNKTESKEVTRNTKIAKSVRNKRIKLHKTTQHHIWASRDTPAKSTFAIRDMPRDTQQPYMDITQNTIYGHHTTPYMGMKHLPQHKARVQTRMFMGSDSEEGERKSKEQYATTRQPTSNKDDAFVWKKKQVEEGTDKLSSEQKQMISKQKEREKKVELWKVQQRRRERELEQAARAEEIDRERQEKEGVLFKEWQDQEGQFHLEQARKRSEIRIKDNRANPIDLIAYYIYNANETSVEITGEPISVVENLNLEDLEDLQV
eukprot:sb/3461334/